MEKRKKNIQIFVIILLFLIKNIYSQDSTFLKIFKGNHFIFCNIEGVIFNDTVWYGSFKRNEFVNEYGKVSHISLCEYFPIEEKIRKYVKRKTRNGRIKLTGPGNDCPNIINEWNNYIRQIVCYKKSEKNYVLIKFIHKNYIQDHPYWQYRLNQTYEGCSNYWEIEYDIEKNKAFNFIIN
ncbi:MAG: hypothetical protein Kow0079_16590 [Vicingaceae bacterium]